MSKRFKAGDRVKYTGSPVLGPAHGSRGTVSTVAGVRGRSVHPDPCGLMTFVDWDNGRPQGVFTRHLEALNGPRVKYRAELRDDNGALLEVREGEIADTPRNRKTVMTRVLNQLQRPNREGRLEASFEYLTEE